MSMVTMAFFFKFEHSCALHTSNAHLVLKYGHGSWRRSCRGYYNAKPFWSTTKPDLDKFCRVGGSKHQGS